jgi:lambda family phage tail tape measure protein
LATFTDRYKLIIETADAEKKISGVKNAFTSLSKVGAAAGAAAAGGLALIVRQNLAAIDNFDKLNKRLGISVESLSQLQFVAEQNGVSFETFSTAIQRLQRRVSEAAQGTGEAKNALAELGLNAERLTRLPLDRQFEIVSEALSNVSNSADRTRLAMRLLDTEGVALLQIMEDGAAGIRRLTEEADELGLTLTDLDTNKVAAANDSINRLSSVMTALGRTITVELAPYITDLSEYLREEFVNNAGNVRDVIREAVDIFRSFAEVAKVLANNLDLVVTAGSALVGLNIGAKFGPWGAVIGTVAGALAGQLLPAMRDTKSAMEDQIEETENMVRSLQGAGDASDEQRRKLLEEAIARREIIKAQIQQQQEQIRINQTVTEGANRPGLDVARQMESQLEVNREALERNNQNIQNLRDQLNGVEQDAKEAGEALELTITKSVPPVPGTKPDAITDEAAAIRDRIETLQRNAEEQRRLADAQREGAEAVREMMIQIEAENEARRLNIELGSKKFQQIKEAIAAEKEAFDERQRLIQEQRKEEREADRERERRIQDTKRNNERAIELAERYTEQLKNTTQDAKFELEALNMDPLERQMAEIERTIQRDLKSQIRSLQNLKTGSNNAEINRRIQQLREEARVAIEQQQRIAEEVYETQRSFSYGWEQAFREYEENATNAAKLAEDVFKKTTKGMEDAIVGFAKTGKFEWRDFVSDIVETLLRSRIQKLIADIFGGTGLGGSTQNTGSSSILGGLTSLFAGAFADGGRIPSGQFGLVGERGPELVTGPANITPIQPAQANNSVVNYNINAVDAQSFKQLVARDPEFITAVVDQGRKKVPKTRR